jgi:hypothetical protein
MARGYRDVVIAEIECVDRLKLFKLAERIINICLEARCRILFENVVLDDVPERIAVKLLMIVPTKSNAEMDTCVEAGLAKDLWWNFLYYIGCFDCGGRQETEQCKAS